MAIIARLLYIIKTVERNIGDSDGLDIFRIIGLILCFEKINFCIIVPALKPYLRNLRFAVQYFSKKILLSSVSLGVKNFCVFVGFQ